MIFLRKHTLKHHPLVTGMTDQRLVVVVKIMVRATLGKEIAITTMNVSEIFDVGKTTAVDDLHQIKQIGGY